MTTRQSLATFTLGIIVGIAGIIGMYAFAQGQTGPTTVQLDMSNCVSHIYKPGGGSVPSGMTRLLEDYIVTSIGYDADGQLLFTTAICQ